MYEYYREYVRAKGDDDAQDRWARQLTWEIARHAVGEEIIVYPLMEKHLGKKGTELTDQDRADHQARISTICSFNTKFMAFDVTVCERKTLPPRLPQGWLV